MSRTFVVGRCLREATFSLSPLNELKGRNPFRNHLKTSQLSACLHNFPRTSCNHHLKKSVNKTERKCYFSTMNTTLNESTMQTLPWQVLSSNRRKSNFTSKEMQIRLHSHKVLNKSIADVNPFASVKNELNQMQKDIKEELKTRIGLLEDCSYYYFDGKGKQIRPTTIFLAGKLCNMHTNKKSDLSDGQRRIAMISEMIHTASLLHDDVIDEATTRRGKPSVNMVFTDKQSILAGDYILSKASIALARIGSCRAVELIAEIIEDLVKGEIMQLFIDDNSSKRFNDYIDKTYRKTASLIANSCKAVAVLGNCGEEVEDIVFKFGKNIGIAFQLVDDALDFTASPSELGKPVTADLALGLATAPVLYATENFPELEELVMRRFSEPDDVQKAYQFVKQSNGIQRTMDLASEYVNEAIKLIKLLDPSPERDYLVDLAKFVVKRTK